MICFSKSSVVILQNYLMSRLVYQFYLNHYYRWNKMINECSIRTKRHTRTLAKEKKGVVAHCIDGWQKVVDEMTMIVLQKMFNYTQSERQKLKQSLTNDINLYSSPHLSKQDDCLPVIHLIFQCEKHLFSPALVWTSNELARILDLNYTSSYTQSITIICFLDCYFKLRKEETTSFLASIYVYVPCLLQFRSFVFHWQYISDYIILWIRFSKKKHLKSSYTR